MQNQCCDKSSLIWIVPVTGFEQITNVGEQMTWNLCTFLRTKDFDRALFSTKYFDLDLEHFKKHILFAGIVLDWVGIKFVFFWFVCCGSHMNI